MHRLAFLSLGLSLLGCLGAVDETRLNTSADAGTQQTNASTCAVDTDCGDGMVCEACATGQKSCAPGCRETSQCPEFMVCVTNVVCDACPCAPGWCYIDPCRDVDGDGFVPSSVVPQVCPGKRQGDCNDGDAKVNPDAKELCGNYRDDNCDGKVDAQDSVTCDQCAQGQRVCSNNSRCVFGSTTCDRGCCKACEPVAQPVCAMDQCLLPGGFNPDTGCPAAPICGACLTCPAVQAPVCGRNYGTYANDCFARAAGTEVLHDGACLANEGRSCVGYSVGTRANCGSGLYCRDACPGCDADVRQCTRVGACVVDADCPAGITGTVLCPDNTIAPLACQQGVCVTRCAP